MSVPDYNWDWIVIGSGFGGSVAALRLAEKGYTVGMLECGRRFADSEFADRMSQLRRSVWMPRLGLKGTLRLTSFKANVPVDESAFKFTPPAGARVIVR